jgi:hypothetical protein
MEPQLTTSPIAPIGPHEPFSRTDAYPRPPSTATPSSLKSWWSNDIWRITTFTIMMMCVLGVTSTAFFSDKLSADQYLGVISSLLFLAVPSPIQPKPKKKIYYLNDRHPV